jgi:hypothetical protein
MKTLVILIFAVAMVLAAASCGDKYEFGCTDPDSINYSSIANVDDGSCEYEGTLVFWFDKESSDVFIASESEKLYIDIDDEMICFQNRHTDQLLTKDHTVFAKIRRHSRNNEDCCYEKSV